MFRKWLSFPKVATTGCGERCMNVNQRESVKCNYMIVNDLQHEKHVNVVVSFEF